jgi:hypothetical protein
MADFDRLFETVRVAVQPGCGESYTLRRTMCATAAAAQDALALVRKYEPSARLQQVAWGNGRPYLGDKPIWEIVLPNGTRLNAGLVLAQYYQNGWGANAVTEAQLAEEVSGNCAAS